MNRFVIYKARYSEGLEIALIESEGPKTYSVTGAGDALGMVAINTLDRRVDKDDVVRVTEDPELVKRVLFVNDLLCRQYREVRSAASKAFDNGMAKLIKGITLAPEEESEKSPDSGLTDCNG